MPSIGVLLFVLLAVALPGAVNAQTTATPTKWEYEITPYLWFASVKGTTGTEGRTASVDTKFSDVFDKVKFAGMMTIEAHRGKLSLLADLYYTDVEDSGDLPGPNFTGVKASSKSFIASLAGGWRVMQNEKSFADAIAGLRIWSVKTNLDFTGGTSPETKASSTSAWVDPVIGGRFRTALSPKWSVSILGDIGGFSIGSRFSWELYGAFHLDVGRGNAVVFGYRVLDVDYRKSGDVYDTQQFGPTLGFTFHL